MEFIHPKTLNEAIRALAKTRYSILAGGTDLIVQWKVSGKYPKGVINIWNLDELKNIKELKNSVEIGALATHAEIYKNKTVKRYLPSLVQACKTIGALQIQNRGTIGGNVMNGSPAGDTLPVLLVYEAQVELKSLRGTRVVPFDGFYTDYRKTVVKKDEIVTKFIFPLTLHLSPKGRGQGVRGERAVFMKIGTRSAQTISKVCACFRVLGGDRAPPLRRGDPLRSPSVTYFIAYGSVAKTPIRCKKTEEFLNGRELTEKVINLSVELVQNEISPIDDIRSNVSYRRHVSGVLLRRFLLGC